METDSCFSSQTLFRHKPFIADLLRLPGSLNLITLLHEDLAQGQNLLVLLPDSMDAEALWAVVYGQLERQAFQVCDLFLPGLLTHTLLEPNRVSSPIEILCHRLEAEYDIVIASRSLAALLNTPGLPDVLHLSGLHQLPSDAQQAWLKFLEQWASQAKGRLGQGKVTPAVCLYVSASGLRAPLPSSDVRLRLRWWWGLPSALDMRLLCRMQHTGQETQALSQWREYLIPTLANGHTALIEYLWDRVHLPVEALLTELKKFGLQQGWTPEWIQAQGTHKFRDGTSNSDTLSLTPPVLWRDLWARDVVSYSPEHGLEINSAALAVLGTIEAGWNEQIRHRLWRGQAALLLPILDAIRLAVCERLTHLHGPDWPVRWDTPRSHDEENAVRANPLACELGYLEWLMRRFSVQLGEQRLYQLVKSTHRLRNELAHYKIIRFEDYKNLEAEFRCLRLFA